jgi:YjbE family integral membrane protein
MNIFLFGSMMGGVILLDLLLSGDNVLVIGAAAAQLARRERWYAIAVGGIMAIVLRIIFTVLAAVLLNIPFIQTVGAMLLIYVAQKLLQGRESIGTSQTPQENQSTLPRPIQRLLPLNNTFLSALLTILIADLTMSLDNILAVGALANGELLPLAIGLVGSITILMVGSAAVSILVEHFRWLLDVASLVLAWTSATMIHDDLSALASSHHLSWLLALNQPVLPLHLSWLLIIIAAVTCSLMIFFNLFYRFHKERQTA